MLLSGQVGASNTQVFSVDGSGDLAASGYVDAGTSMFAPSYIWSEAALTGAALVAPGDAPTVKHGDAPKYVVFVVMDVVGSTYGGECTIDVSGNLFCTGTLGPAIATPTGGKVGMYSMQTPENWIEDFGSAQLVNGVAKINIESQLKGVVSGTSEYHVYVTPAGDCEGLFVTNRTAGSFEVHELRGGKSSVAFDYRIVVHRKGFENTRMPDLSARFGNAEAKRPKAEAPKAHIAPISGHAD